MKIKNISVCVAFSTLAACGSDCTEEELQQKMLDVTAEVHALAASGDVAKITEFYKQAQEISMSAGRAEGGLQAACEAVDDLLAEF